MAAPLCQMLVDRIEALLADKGYDAGAIRAEVAVAGVEVAIPARRNRSIPIPHDSEKDRWRSLVEHMSSKRKNVRSATIRYD
jgi:hypothetical protein